MKSIAPARTPDQGVLVARQKADPADGLVHVLERCQHEVIGLPDAGPVVGAVAPRTPRKVRVLLTAHPTCHRWNGASTCQNSGGRSPAMQEWFADARIGG